MTIKAFLPKSLFARALLILVLPTVLIQMVMAYVFFDRHWGSISKHLSNSLAGETAFLVRQLTMVPARQKPQMVLDFERTTGIDVHLDVQENFASIAAQHPFPDFEEQLASVIKEPFKIRKINHGDDIEINVRLASQTLRLITTSKRLESPTTFIYALWMVGVSVVFLVIAIIFLRNQIRPIRRLAQAADNFGRGLDTPGFRPHGASEVRTAARAFITMRERIKRQLKTRTEMLAGISHDLRTPLTRMKLQLAMLPDTEATQELSSDVVQMEHMIQEYLDFARGEGGEEALSVNMPELLMDVVADYKRAHADVEIESLQEVTVDIRLSAFRRMLHNLVDNALRYGKRCRIHMNTTRSACEIMIDDDGPGIPADKREEVFRPFSRLDPARNVDTGGVGLGLTIARDIILAHGGAIALLSSPMGGLRVVIRLPL